MPPVILSLDKIDEMQRITRSERYLEIGAMVTLSRIIEMRKFAPAVLVQCLRNIAGPQLRNMATIGGNVCGHGDSVAALNALDAQYELKTAQSSRWITASRFSPTPDAGDGSANSVGPLNSRELVSRIRVPLDNWDYSAYKKFPGQASGDPVCAAGSVVFLAGVQKNMLADVRVICKTAAGIRRDKDGEILLIGKRLPLTRRMAAAFVARWERGSDGMDGLSRKELVGFIEKNVGNLVE